MKKIVIFGAKSIALGVCCAVRELYENCTVDAFLVSSKAGNPERLAGLPVLASADYEDKDTYILIATPESIQEEIVKMLESQGFHNRICIDSRKEAELMERYYEKTGMFASVHAL